MISLAIAYAKYYKSRIVMYWGRFKMGFQMFSCCIVEGTDFIKRLPEIAVRYEISCRECDISPYAKLKIVVEVTEDKE